MSLDSFISSALLLLLVTSIAVAVFKQLGLGSILGLLVAGIVVGPYSPGPYVTVHVEEVRHFTELGVVLLLFLIGVEIQPKRLWDMRREVLGLGSLQILITGAALGLYFLVFEYEWKTAFFIGLTFALSSTAFVLQLLHEKGEFASLHGRTAFSILLMQDLAIVPMLALLPIVADTGTLSADVPLWQQVLIVTGTFAAITLFGRVILPKTLESLAKRGNKESFLLVVILAVFFAAWSMHAAGMSMELGAFIMGMLLSGSRYRLQVQAVIEPYKGLLMSLFFVAVGMSINIGALAQTPLLFAQHAVMILVLKSLLLMGLCLFFGATRRTAIKVGLLLSQGGEFGFILFGAAKALDIIDDQTFVIAVGVISFTMLATPLLVKLGEHLTRRDDGIAQSSLEKYQQSHNEELQGRVIIAGYGRVGHTVATLLLNSDVPFIAFDANTQAVAKGQKDGLPVFYGDISDPELLRVAHAEQASLVIITIDHGPTALKAISYLRSNYPQLPVISRARDLAECGQLMEAGASHAYPEALESSLHLGALAMEIINVPVEEVERLLQDIRSNNYQLINATSTRSK